MEWVPAISTTSLLVIVLWLSRNLVFERLKGSVRHEYEEKIENVRTELRKSEGAFRSKLKEKESQIDALRNGALSGIVSRQDKLYQRKILAVEQLWKAVVSLAPAKNISTWVATIKFDVAAKEAAKNPQLREMFSVLDGFIDLKKINVQEADFSRPFLSPLVWALFSAYRSIVLNAVFKMQSLKSGIDKDFTNVEGVTNVVKAALPEYESYIEEHGINAFHYLLDILESKIISELENMLSGEAADKESIERASRILKESERLMETNSAVDDSK